MTEIITNACKMCGHEEARLMYCCDAHDPRVFATRIGLADSDEHLDATCERCGYKWRVEVLSKATGLGLDAEHR